VECKKCGTAIQTSGIFAPQKLFTTHNPELAKRIDEALPEIEKKQTF
jgi:hypothetical protein